MLSVVTIVRNRDSALRGFLSGLARQRVHEPFEVVIGDVGEGLRFDIAADYPQLPVRLVSVPYRSGAPFPYAAARNAAAERATGDKLIFLDADVIASSTVVKSFSEALDTHRVLATSEVRYLPPPEASGYPEDEDELYRLSLPHPARPEPPKLGVGVGADHNLLWSLCLAMHASTFDAIGRFDAGYVGYGAEDTDLTWTARSQGIPAALIGQAPVFHQHHPYYNPPLHRTTELVGNARRFYQKWGWWPMGGWLTAMQEMGIIEWHADAGDIQVARGPTDSEMQHARRTAAAPFLKTDA